MMRKFRRVQIGDLLAAEAVDAIRTAHVRNIVVEAHQLDVAVRHVFGILVGACAGELRLVRLGIGFLGRDDDGRRARRAERLEEGRRRLLHLQRDFVVAGDVDAGDRVEEVAGRADLRVAIERRLDVGGGHLLAVVEFDALAQLEDVRETVIGDVEQFGEDRDRFDVLAEGVEHLVDVHVDVARGLRRGDHRVEARRIGTLDVDEFSASRRRQGPLGDRRPRNRSRSARE